MMREASGVPDGYRPSLMGEFGQGSEALIPPIPLSPVQKLRRSRSTPILHADIHEPAVDYKILVDDKIRWPHTFHRYHLIDGISVVDHGRVVLSARDQAYRTKMGKYRNSSGTVTYNYDSYVKVCLDADCLGDVLNDYPPNGVSAWKIHDVEHHFRLRQGRPGVWKDYKLPLASFFSLFRRTFELYGTHADKNSSYVRLRHKWGANSRPKVIDNIEEIMIHLARLREPKLLKYHALKMLSPVTDVFGATPKAAASHKFSTHIQVREKIPEDLIEVARF